MKKKTAILSIVLVLLVLIAGTVWYFNHPQPGTGQKALSITVIHSDGAEKEFPFTTTAKTLRQACEEQQLLAGRESEYGLYVLTVDGETAEESLQQWWCITKNGAEHFYGVDDTMIQDGDRYEFTLKTGW